MQDELATLQHENEQLKRLVQSLSDKLKAIYLIIGDVVNADVHLTSFVLSNDKMEDSMQNPLYSLQKIKDGIIYYEDAYVKNKEGISETLNSLQKNNNGIIDFNNANHKNKEGINYTNDAHHENNIGINPVNEAILKTQLRKEIRKSSDEGIENTAKILIQLQSGTQQSYAALRKLTKLSTSGMAKRIMALKNKGLIVRTGFQLYSLTQKSIQMLNIARQ